jgi:four helix bundle protein
MKSHKELTVWQKSMELAELIYKITAQLPKSEAYGLSSQMQRAAVAISSNIAEGAKRSHRLEYIQFLSITNGSASELETQLLLGKKLYQSTTVDFESAIKLIEEILKMLFSLINYLKGKKL